MPHRYYDYIPPKYMPPLPQQKPPAPHPGSVLSALIACGSTDHPRVLDAGLDADWLARFMRGAEDLILPDDARAALLALATGIPAGFWLETQGNYYERLADEQMR